MPVRVERGPQDKSELFRVFHSGELAKCAPCQNPSTQNKQNIMSHGIIKPIDAIFSTQGSEWHKLATVVPSIGETEFFSLSPRIHEGKAAVMIDGKTVPLDNHKVLVADYRECRPDLAGTENELVPLHIPKNSYRPIENAELFALLRDSLSDVLDNGASVTCAGTLEGGKKCFASVSIGEDLRVKTRFELETIKTSLNFVTSHDGTLGLRCYDSMIRVVCMNTLRWSLEAQGKVGFSVYHTANASLHIKNVAEMVQAIMAGRGEFVECMQELAAIDSDTRAMRQIPLGYFASMQDKQDELATRSLNAAEEITRLAYKGRGNRGVSLYDLANGATEYWTSGDGTGKQSNANERMYKAEFAGAAEHKTRFVQGLLDSDTRNDWQKRGASLETKQFSFAG